MRCWPARQASALPTERSGVSRVGFCGRPSAARHGRTHRANAEAAAYRGLASAASVTMGARVRRAKGARSPQTRRPADPQTRRPADPQTRRPEDPKTRRPEDPKTRRPEDPKTRRPEDRFRRVPTSSGAGTPRAAISHGKRHRVAPGHPSAADRQAAPKFVQAPEFAGLGPHASRRCARATTSDTIADCRAVCRGSCRARPGAPSIGAAARREFVRPGAQARPRSGSSVG